MHPFLELPSRAGGFPLRTAALCLLLALSGCKKSSDETSTAVPADFLAVMNVGKSQYEKGDAAAAVKSFQQAVTQQPTSLDARLNLANALLAAGQPADVLMQTAQVLASDPRSGVAHYLAGCAHLRSGNFSEALKSLQQAKDIDRTVNEVSFQLGIAHEGLKNYDDAITQWRETIEFGPEHPAVYYRLSQAMIRKGETDEAQTLLEKHREVTAGRNLPSDPSFFEQCAHTRMRVPFVLEQPADQGIAVKYQDATAEWLTDAQKYSGPIGLVDLHRTGQPGLLVIEEGRQFRLLTFTNGQFTPIGNPVPADPNGGYVKVLVGDLDADRYDDVIVLGTNRSHVLKISAGGRIADRTMLTGLAQLKATDGELADLDFTSKLSLVAALPDGQGIRFYRSLGNASFKEDTAALGLPTNTFAVTQVTVADWNKDDLPDVLAVVEDGVRYFANQRGGRFLETNAPTVLTGARQIAIDDFNNDFRPDTAFLGTQQLEVTFGGITNRNVSALGGTAFTRLTALDYDNDGWLDLVATGGAAPRVWRNLGTRGWTDTTAALGLVQEPARQLIAADLDNDCDVDLVLALENGGLIFLRNEGGNQNHMVKFKAVGSRSNASGIGARLELTAGNWRGMRTVTRTPLEIGIGQRNQIDSMFIQWTQLRMNLEAIRADECRVSFITEIVQQQMTSCPYLYVWDGETFRFVSDFLAAAPVGLPVAPGKIIAADPEELLWIGNTTNFQPKAGRYVVQLTEELSEVLYLDEVKLVAVDHPTGSQLFSTSKMLPSPPWLPHELVAVQNRIPLRQAFSNTPQPERRSPTRPEEFANTERRAPARQDSPAGSETGAPQSIDVTDRLQAVDNIRVSPAIYGDHLRGWAKTQEIILDFGPLDHTRPLVLALNGWLRFGGAMANIAASQRSELPFPFPTLTAELADGTWQPVEVQVGTPAGRTKSIIVELANKLPAGTKRLKLTHAFELHWDEIALYEKSPFAVPQITRLAPVRADLHYRGFSHDADLDWTHPTTPVYDQLQQIPFVPKVPTGWTTRFGAVDELVAAKDNAFAMINGGEELTVEFDAGELPPVAAGHERQFFLWSVGWDKDTDYYTVLGDQIDPLPWHGMDDQAYGEQPRPAFESDELMKRHTTRWVGPHVPNRQETARR